MLNRVASLGVASSMTKIRVVSDLHLEFAPLELEPAGEDVVVLAGDIGLDIDGARWAERQSRKLGVPFVYVAGNHEFYRCRRDRRTIWQVYDRLHEVAAASGGCLHFLQNETVAIGDTVFIGATLWTDYRLYGDAAEARRVAGFSLNDHRNIMVATLETFSPSDAQAEHEESKACIAQALRTIAGKKVVVTHHGCSALSVHPRWQNDPLTPSFTSALDLMGREPPLWIHGHAHDSFDYAIGETRVVANPRGYVRGGRAENAGFDPNLVIDL
jgi:predicted phosphodiesterase